MDTESDDNWEDEFQDEDEVAPTPEPRSRSTSVKSTVSSVKGSIESLSDGDGYIPGGPISPDSPRSFGSTQSQKFMNEINVFERVGYGNITRMLDENLIIGEKLTDVEKRMRKMFQDPEEKFAVYVNAAARNLNYNDYLKISEKDIENMLEKIKYIDNVKYKNPNAYVLGFMAIKGGEGGIKQSNLARSFEAMQHTKGSVRKPDVIRYARMISALEK